MEVMYQPALTPGGRQRLYKTTGVYIKVVRSVPAAAMTGQLGIVQAVGASLMIWSVCGCRDMEPRDDSDR
ncbi:hypothetical protein NPIL_512381 [Nephila pilipes]|uniref:Uncharacterized protein n=1 Tax=Nephila pilipes TaxID=299642 RepID=A0A8X6UL37_NEPPI|nr:hypothetical protein NPIL_512381 [Nephila pilipes]